MSTLVIGTLGELRAIRARWAVLPPAAAALRELGLASQADQVAAIASAIGSARFAVLLPCMFCRSLQPVDVVIGDPHRAEPRSVICGTCSADIDERVAAATAAPGLEKHRA